MTLRKIIFAKTFVLLGMWWGCTVLVDFFVIPNVFRTIDIFFKAGELGIVVFSKLNALEVILGSALVGMLSYQVSKNRKALPMLMMAIVLWIIAMTYFSFLSPKISELTALWKEADQAGQMSIARYPDIQQAHQFYHKLYIGIDTFKLLLLTFMISYGVVKQEKWS